MANFSMRNPNATLSFKAHGANNVARVRISKTGYTYGVNSTESHSRLERAFYPHRRSLGQFTVTIDAIGYREYRNFMNWLRLYADALFGGQTGTQKGATTIEVYMASRNFHKVGILTTGIDDHDHVGSMVFSPQLHFMMIKDYHDPGTAIVSTASTSQFRSPPVQSVETAAKGAGGRVSIINDRSGTAAFYPVTIASYKDMDSTIYNLPDPTLGPTGGVTSHVITPGGGKKPI